MKAHTQDCLKQWMASEKNPSKIVLTVYKKSE